jgi:hypothetical protein
MVHVSLLWLSEEAGRAEGKAAYSTKQERSIFVRSQMERAYSAEHGALRQCLLVNQKARRQIEAKQQAVIFYRSLVSLLDQSIVSAPSSKILFEADKKYDLSLLQLDPQTFLCFERDEADTFLRSASVQPDLN